MLREFHLAFCRKMPLLPRMASGRFAPLRLLVLILIILVVYCLWPRQPSLAGFNPQDMGTRLSNIWADAEQKKNFGVFCQEYLRHDLDYRLPPVDCLQMSWNLVQARSMLEKSSDPTVQENAQGLVREYYLRMRNQLKAGFEPEKAAVLEVNWLARASDAVAEKNIVNSQAELLAVLYGGSREKFQDVAKNMYAARLLAEKAGDEAARAEARDAAVKVFQELKAVLAPAEAPTPEAAPATSPQATPSPASTP